LSYNILNWKFRCPQAIMGWIKYSTAAEEVNASCVFTSNVEHMTRILMKIHICGSWIKKKVKDKTSMGNIRKDYVWYTDIGTKRVPQSLLKAPLIHSSEDNYVINQKMLQKSSIFGENFKRNLNFLACRTVRTYYYLWVFQKYRNDTQFKKKLTWQCFSITGIAKHSFAILHVYVFMSCTVYLSQRKV
jgi:hypothetical protein